jgi:hypothetical protein
MMVFIATGRIMGNFERNTIGYYRPASGETKDACTKNGSDRLDGK